MTTFKRQSGEEHPWSAHDILAALAEVSSGMQVKERLRVEPSGEVLVEALRLAPTDNEREILCDVLGDRHETIAIESLLAQLANPEVRAAAADALAKIGDPAAGPALAEWFDRETVSGTRAMLAAALGAVGHGASASTLIQALDDRSPSVRGSAAWSLGRLGAVQALEPLEGALARETSGYARERLKEAIEALTRNASE